MRHPFAHKPLIHAIFLMEDSSWEGVLRVKANDLLVSIVVPVYRSGSQLHVLHERLRSAMSSCQIRYELILVEDAGGDDSWSIIEALSERDSSVLGIRLNKNFGQHNALLCGLDHASGDVVVTLDDDLQHPPELVPDLIDSLLEEDYDLVYAPPIVERQSFVRNMLSRSTKLFMKLVLGAGHATHVSAFRVFRSSLLSVVRDHRSPNVNIDILLSWGTSNVGVVPVNFDRRGEGESGYTHAKLLKHAFNLLTGYSTLPLRISSLIGLAFALFGLLVLIYVVTVRLMTSDPVPGFAFLASLIAIFSGVQLVAIGLIGEYLARIYERSMDRPPYLIAQIKGAEQSAKHVSHES